VSTSPSVPYISDQEFKYIGLTQRQVDLLRDQPADLRHIVYEEALKILMENGPGYGSHPTESLNF
jgi:hypothetical protein